MNSRFLRMVLSTPLLHGDLFCFDLHEKNYFFRKKAYAISSAGLLSKYPSI